MGKFYTQRDSKKGNVVIANYDKQRDYILYFESPEQATQFVEGLYNAQYRKKLIGNENKTYRQATYLSPNERKVCVNFDKDHVENWPFTLFFDDKETTKSFYHDLTEVIFGHTEPAHVL